MLKKEGWVMWMDANHSPSHGFVVVIQPSK